MIKVKEFITKENYEIDEQINDFVKDGGMEIVDIKYNTFLDTYHNIIMSSALLMYKDPFDMYSKLATMPDPLDNCIFLKDER